MLFKWIKPLRREASARTLGWFLNKNWQTTPRLLKNILHLYAQKFIYSFINLTFVLNQNV